MKPNVAGTTFVDGEAALLHHALTVTDSGLLPRINERMISGRRVLSGEPFAGNRVVNYPEVQQAALDAADAQLSDPNPVHPHLQLPLLHEQADVALGALEQAYKQRLLKRDSRKPARVLLVEAGVMQPRVLDRAIAWAGQSASRIFAGSNQ